MKTENNGYENQQGQALESNEQDTNLDMDVLAKKLNTTCGSLIKALTIVFDCIKSYREKSVNVSDSQWIEHEFAKHDDIWEGKDALSKKAEIKEAADEIISNINGYEEAKQDLQKHIDMGDGDEKWLSLKIEKGAALSGIDPGQYAEEIIEALDDSNGENIEYYSEEGNKRTSNG